MRFEGKRKDLNRDQKTKDPKKDLTKGKDPK